MFQRFWRNYRGVITKLLLFMAPFIPLLLMKAPPLPRFNIYDRVQATVVHPIAELINNAVGGVSVLWDRYIYLVETQEKNKELLDEKAALEARILELEESSQENQRLKEILKMPLITSSDVLAAQLIGDDSSGEAYSFFINAGEKQGLKPRMPVLSAQGIVGTINRVYANSAMFTAVQDPSHSVDGMIVRSRAQFIVEGRGQSLTGRLKYLDRAADVRVGDLVITSGLDGVFPKGLRIGYIIKVDRPQTGITQVAELRPTADLSYIEEVLVLKTPPREDQVVEEPIEASAR